MAFVLRLPLDVQRLVWSWYILPLRVRAFRYKLTKTAFDDICDIREFACAFVPRRPKHILTLFEASVWVRKELACENDYAFDAIVYLGRKGTCFYFCQYSGPWDVYTWLCKQEYVRFIGNTERMYLLPEANHEYIM